MQLELSISEVVRNRSYRSKDRKPLRTLIYEYLLSHGARTNKEISKALGMEINCVTGRINEMRKLGTVVYSHLKRCSVTGNMVCAWEVRK